MATRMQQRRGTAAQWTAANPILAAGEIGFETDTSRFKMGNGSSAWSALEYFANSAELSALLDGAPDLLNTLNELAASIGDDPDFIGTVTAHTSATTDVHGIPDTSVLVTQTDLSDAISNTTGAYSDLAGTGIDWNSGDERFDIDSTIATVSGMNTAIQIARTDVAVEILAAVNGAADDATAKVSDHNSETTNVHGIDDTAELATKTYAVSAVSTHNTDTTDVHGIPDTSLLVVQADLEEHNSATTDIHGIVDVAELATNAYVDGAAFTAISSAAAATDTKIAEHNDETAGVHGIADTALLATMSYADQAEADAILAAGSAADTKVSAHNAETENVHGISDTSILETQTGAQAKADNAVIAAGAAADTKVADAVAALTKSSVGLGNVDNTSDADKPVSTATQTALDAKASLAGATFTGDVEVDGNLVVDGDFTVNGTNFSASATSITIEDNMVQLAHQNAANTVDLGLVVAYNDGSAKHAGIVRDVSDAKWKLFKDVSTEPSTVVAFGEGSLDALAVGALEATTVTPSSGIVFSDGTQVKVGVPSITEFATGISSSATLAAGEQDKFVPLTGAVTITLPATGYSTGQSIDFYQASGTGAQFASTNSVVGTPGLKLRTTNSVATAMKTSSGWLVFGDLSA